jgi:hypothetical protein
MSGPDYVLLWAKAFALTLSVELAVAVPLLRRTGVAFGRRIVLVTLAQLATHPVVWFVLPELHLPRAAFLIVAEVWAFGVEAWFYRAAALAPLGRAVIVSAVANATSFLFGTMLRLLGVDT